MARKKPAYKGELATPIRHIPPKPDTTLGNLAKVSSADLAAVFEPENDRLRNAYMAAISKRLPLLFQHYGIQDGEYVSLALALAFVNHSSSVCKGPFCLFLSNVDMNAQRGYT